MASPSTDHGGGDPDSRNSLEDLFAQLDEDSSGNISKEELMFAMKKMCVKSRFTHRVALGGCNAHLRPIGLLSTEL